MLIIDLLILICSAVTLIKSVDIFIKASSKIAQHLQISKFTISFFLIAVATSTPELTVAISSGANDNSILTYGVVIGSNIALLTLITALSAFYAKGLDTYKIVATKDIYITAGLSLLPIIMSLDKKITSVEGVILVAAYSIYIFATLRKAKGVEMIIDTFEPINIYKEAVYFIGSLLFMLGASQVIVQSTLNMSTSLSIGLGLLGLTITAIGTSLPEIAFSIAAVKRGEQSYVTGDIIGSIAANSTIVLGIGALISQIDIASSAIKTTPIILTFIATLLFVFYAKSKNKISIAEGATLLLVYIIFLLVEFV